MYHQKIHVHSLNYFPLLGYAKYGNGVKNANFRGRARRPALGAFLRDIDGKIVGIPQCRALGTTLFQYHNIIGKVLTSTINEEEAAA